MTGHKAGKKRYKAAAWAWVSSKLKSKYRCFVSARRVSRHPGMDVSLKSQQIQYSRITN